jgi:mono/diheme cytochrome c family protein
MKTSMYHRNEAILLRRRIAASLLSLVILLVGLLSQVSANEQHPAEPHRHPEAEKIKNPLSSDPQSIEEGKKLYARFCASCHGAGAKGDGSLALAGGEPSDLTDETWDHGSSDGEIFVAIRDGVSADMLAYSERLNEKQIWQIVNFLRSVGPKQTKK